MDQANDSGNRDTLQPGTHLGRYEIIKLLGQGGMGAVYEGVHRDLKKRVAIKTLLPSLTANHEARQRFLREGEAASRIRHPHVVDVTDVGVEGTLTYLVMEFLEGQDLSKLLSRQGALSFAQTADIMLPVAAAIAAAHEQGVIHRDLKPENIFLARAGGYGGVHPKVLDFGISKVLGDKRTMALTGTAATFGTMFYLPPEQLRGARQADAKSDQYALGTIVYECVTGLRAFEGDNFYMVLKNIAEGEFVRPSERRPDLPPRLEAVILRAMRLDPAERFDSAMHFGAALLEFASPGAQMLWGPVFGAAPPELQYPAAPSSPSIGSATISANLPPMRSGATTGREHHRAASTTMRHATGESETFREALRPRRSKVPLIAGIGVAAAGVAVIAVLKLGGGGGTDHDTGTTHATHVGTPETTSAPGSTAAQPETYKVEIATEPDSATIEIDGHTVGTGTFNDVLRVDGVAHTVIARAPGFQDATVRFTDRPPPRLIALVAVPKAPPPPPPRDEPAEARPVAEARSHGGGGHGKHDKPERPARGGGHHSSGGDEPAKGPAKGPAPEGGGKPDLLPNNAPIID
jgi:serine/threonine-protein kinase